MSESTAVTDGTPKYARLLRFIVSTRTPGNHMFIDPTDVKAVYCDGGSVPCKVVGAAGLEHFVAESVEGVRAALAAPKTLAEWGDDSESPE